MIDIIPYFFFEAKKRGGYSVFLWSQPFIVGQYFWRMMTRKSTAMTPISAACDPGGGGGVGVGVGLT